MAIADGYFEDVDQPITDFIPELAAKGFGDVTIHYLLTMMSGSDYQENDNPFGERVILNFTPQLEERILRTQMGAPPGTVFRYKSGDNALLGLALARTLEP
jgi:CubicO group peptidase (beta-lactamase class C family)